jgi:hypothetical protein
MDGPTIDVELLESWIDRGGLVAVIEAVSVIAREKAEHVATTWDDAELARRWARVADRLDSRPVMDAVFAIPR